MTWIKLTKGGLPVWLNATLMIRIDPHEKGSHIDFQDGDLEDVVDQSPEAIMALIEKHHVNRVFE